MSTHDGRHAAAGWLCRLAAGAERVEPLRHAPEAVVALAREHRLDARAGARLAAGDHPDAAALAPLGAAWRRTLGEQALWGDLVARVDRGLDALGRPGLLLKGADLSTRLYGPGERPHNDLDLLVLPRDAAAAEDVLRASGLVPEAAVGDAARRHWFASTWRDPRRPRLQLDLHTALGPRGRVLWSAEEVLGRSTLVPGCAAIRRMDSVDLVVHLALHAVAFHGATGRWIWWLDLHLAAGEAGEPRRLEARAREAGGIVALRAALERTRSLFGDASPGPRVPGPRRGTLVAKLGAALERTGAPPRLGGAGRRLVAALAIDRPAALGTVARDVAARVLDRARAASSVDRPGGRAGD